MKRLPGPALTVCACVLFFLATISLAGAGSRSAESDPPNTTASAKKQPVPVRQDSEAGACFAADTLVLMADGSYKKIMDISAGEKVKTFDLGSGQMVTTEVIRTKRGFAGYHYLVNGKLKITPPHPFCTNDNKWIRIEDLKKGQKVRTANSIGEISTIENKLEGHPIFNIFVNDHHSFFVSGDGIEFFLVREWR